MSDERSGEIVNAIFRRVGEERNSATAGDGKREARDRKIENWEWRIENRYLYSLSSILKACDEFFPQPRTSQRFLVLHRP
jgi:hypothetical protein